MCYFLSYGNNCYYSQTSIKRSPSGMSQLNRGFPKCSIKYGKNGTATCTYSILYRYATTGSVYKLMREPSNIKDSNAVAIVRRKSGEKETQQWLMTFIQLMRLGIPNGDRDRLIEVKCTVNKGIAFWAFGKCPFIKERPLNRGLTVL